ncbi:unnamed protein product [Prunus armeniaca]
MKDKELNSFATTLHERNDAYLFLEREFANVTHSYDKLLAKFDVCCEAVEESKSEAVVDTYKLGYLDCKEGVALCHPVDDEDTKLFCPKMPLQLKSR